MAINKNAFLRYQALDRCFRNKGRKYVFADLMEAVNKALEEADANSSGIQRRQLYDDINFMMSEAGFSAPIEKERDGKFVYYFYEDRDFSINSQPLNETESNQIKSALMILSRFKGMPQFEWVDEISTKITSALKMEEGMEDIISFDSNEYLQGIHFLGDLFNAIHYKKVLKIRYKPFKGIAEEHEIHPYYLKQYNNRWFLFGYNKKSDYLSNMALDRIEEITEKKGKYFVSEIDFGEYFEDIIGVTRPKDVEPVKIELLFSKEEAPYILTKPIHGSQKKIKQDENGLLISIEVIPNYELEKLILGFGEKVKVLKPKEFKMTVQKRVDQLYITYK